MKLLLVCMAGSIHVARWIRQLEGGGIDCSVFDVDEGDLSPELRGVEAHVLKRPWPARREGLTVHPVWPLPFGARATRRLLGRLGWHIVPPRAVTLARVLDSWQPDVVHTLEMQHAAYCLLDACTLLSAKTRFSWIYSSWGSDLVMFGDHAQHRERVRRVLAGCQYLITDCRRDIELAKTLGFAGQSLGVFPGGGGYRVNELRESWARWPAAARQVIAVKGYEGLAGKGLVALKALEHCRNELRDFQTVVFSASPAVAARALELATRLSLRITVMPQCCHLEILKLLGRSRALLALSESDGSPNTMLEAMIMGAIPIQSDAGAVREWIEDGRNGLLTSHSDAEAVAETLRRALRDDKLVENASTWNARVAKERLDEDLVRPQVLAAYRVACPSSTHAPSEVRRRL